MHRLVAPLALAVLLAAPAGTEAQLVLGGALAIHEDADFGMGVFGAAPVPSVHENLGVGGDFTVFFPDGGDYLEINGNVIYWFRGEDLPVTPFVLGGLNLAQASNDAPPAGEDDSSTEIGLNIGGGVEFESVSGAMRPVVGAKLELDGGEGFVAFVGLGFPVG